MLEFLPELLGGNMKATVFLFLISFSASVFSKTLVISDIDDTIKISHVLSSSKRLIYALKTDRAFKGMSELYSAIKASNKEVRFVYLSNAPQNLMLFSHEKFLKQNYFPEGNIILRKNISDKTFKLKVLRELLRTESPQKVIFFGDNAESDIDFYAQVSKEFPNVTFSTFIRTLYKQQSNPKKVILPLQDGQEPFVTALDLAYELHQDQIISRDDWMYLAVLFSHQILSEDLSIDESSEYFPSWKECDLDSDKYVHSTQLIQSAFDKISNFCSKEFLLSEGLLQKSASTL